MWGVYICVGACMWWPIPIGTLGFIGAWLTRSKCDENSRREECKIINDLNPWLDFHKLDDVLPRVSFYVGETCYRDALQKYDEDRGRVYG